VTFALAILHVSFDRHVLARWQTVYGQSRALVPAVGRLHASLGPDELALVLAPGAIDDIPFARNAQGGLMLPPMYPASLSNKILVQQFDEIPLLPDKIVAGVVTTLRHRTVYDYLAGKRLTTTPPEYPSRVVCWSSLRERLVPLDVAPGPDPQAYARSLQRAVDTACPQKPTTR
jgi:hypothetical protein